MIEIKHRLTGAVIYTAPDATTTREALEAAIRAHADLAGADLAGAYLAHADLAGADLAGAYLAHAYLAHADLAGADLADANLADANLAHANLADANLAHANLAHADLADADLAGANLADANLAHANLAHADLADADLADADLAHAYLADADLAGANLADANLADANLADARNVPSGTERIDPPEPYERIPGDGMESRRRRAERYRRRHPNIPVVESLDSKILARVESGDGKLDMSQWHSETCNTTHCRAGWAIALAGEAGYALERERGSQAAGAAIYRASTGRVPHFFASNEAALEDIRRRAAEEAARG
jgi:hypothetical protein